MTCETLEVSVTESPRNAWRQTTPGPAGWSRSARPDDPNKYFMVSADCHANEPASYLAEYIEPEYRDRIPHLEVHDDGSGVLGHRGQPSDDDQAIRRSARRGVRGRSTGTSQQRMEPEDALRNTTGRTIEERLADQSADGIDIELIFPNKGLLCWATPDPVFADAMCRAWNRWAYDGSGGADGWHDGRTRPLASIATGDVDCAMAEAALGRRARLRRPVPRQQPRSTGPRQWGNLEYNDPAFERVLVARRGDGPSGHVPRVDRSRPTSGRRQRRGDHQLRLPLDGDHDRAARAAHHVGRVRAPPRTAGRPRRVRHRLRAVAARDDGLRLQGAPLLGAAGDPRAAVDVLPAQLLRDVPGGSRRSARPPSSTTSSTT